MNNKPRVAVWLSEQATEQEKQKVNEMFEQPERFQATEFTFVPRQQLDAANERIRQLEETLRLIADECEEALELQELNGHRIESRVARIRDNALSATASDR